MDRISTSNGAFMKHPFVGIVAGKGKVEKFEDLLVWQRAMDVARDVYREFKECRDYGLRDQIQRSAVSMACNIAEGFERRSNREFIQYLYIAKGSCAELRTQLSLCKDIGLISESAAIGLIGATKEISAMLYGLIKTRKEKFS